MLDIQTAKAAIITHKAIYTCYANFKNHISVGHRVRSPIKYSSERSFWQLNRETGPGIHCIDPDLRIKFPEFPV